MATYPGGITAFALHNVGDTIQPADINAPGAEIVAIETALLNGFQHNLLPTADDTYSLGSTSKRWLKGWFQDLDFDGAMSIGSFAGVGAPIVSNASKQLVEQALTNGQLLIGSTGAAPVAAVVTASLPLSVTNGAGSIALASMSAYVLDRQVSTQTVANTAVETTVYSVVVPGNTLGTNKTLHVSAIGSWKDNTAPGGHQAVVKVKYGGTVFTQMTITSSGQSANSANFSVDFELTATGATNTQAAKAVLFTGDGGVSNAGGVDSATVGAARVNINTSMSSGAIDSTVNQNLVMTIALSFADPGLTATIKSVYTELK